MHSDSDVVCVDVSLCPKTKRWTDKGAAIRGSCGVSNSLSFDVIVEFLWLICSEEC